MIALKKMMLFLAICGIFLLKASAQSFEIRSVNKGFGVVGVEMRITTGVPPTTTDLITDMVFGIKWKSSYNLNLENVMTTSYYIKKSGTRMAKDTFHFQAFYADQTPYAFAANWQLNNWVEIMTIQNTKNSVTADTGSFVICEKNFHITTDPNIGNSLTDYSPAIAGGATGVILPITLLDFDVSSEKTYLLAKWKTTNEINNKGFELQRSESNANFLPVGWIEGKGNKSFNEYEFADDKAEYNKDYFYRLKQVDIEGRDSSSMIRKARLIGDNFFKLSPNPARAELVLTLPVTFKNSKCSIRLNDAKGAVIYKQELIYSNTGTIKTAVTHLVAGSYFFTLESEGKVVFSQNFVKM